MAGLGFTLQNKPGSATITVNATVNGATPDEETIGITSIAPTGMVSTTKRNDNGIVLVGSGMFVTIYLEPKDVSFSKSVLGEDYVKATYDGFLFEHPKNVWKAGGGDVVNGSKIDGEDHVYWVQFPLGTSARVLTLNIPFGYYDGTAIVPIVTNPHVGTFDGQGGCVITKFGKKATRVPNNVPNLLNAVKNNTSYTDGWKYTD